MKWIKTLSARVRRGDDSSPSRRSLKRKASSPGSLTDQASLGSVEYCGKGRGAPAPANATWKIENILTNGPPSEAEWWGDESTTPGSREEDMEWSSDENSSKLAAMGKFHNCGFAAWELGRVEWRKQTVATRPPKPSPVKVEHVARGIRQGSRQFDLPGPMRLKDLIDVYTVVWDCDSDPF